MRSYKPRNRAKLIEEANKNSLTALLNQDLPIEKKYALVEERNPFLHALFIKKVRIVIKGEEDDCGK